MNQQRYVEQVLREADPVAGATPGLDERASMDLVRILDTPPETPAAAPVGRRRGVQLSIPRPRLTFTILAAAVLAVVAIALTAVLPESGG